MKKLLIILAFLIPCGYANGQDVCPAGKVCLDQSVVNKAAEIADKYRAAKDVIDALQAQVSALQIAVKDRDELIVRIKALGAIDDQIHAKEAQLRAISENMLKLEADIIDRLRKELTGGKTKMQRFLDALKTLYYIVGLGSLVAGL